MEGTTRFLSKLGDVVARRVWDTNERETSFRNDIQLFKGVSHFIPYTEKLTVN